MTQKQIGGWLLALGVVGLVLIMNMETSASAGYGYGRINNLGP